MNVAMPPEFVENYVTQLLARGIKLPLPIDDPIQLLQNAYAKHHETRQRRVYSFGAQPSETAFATYADHSNRLIPVYTFGQHAELANFTGKHSPYRSAAEVCKRYGAIPPNTVDATARYADITDLNRLLTRAAERGAKHLFIVWMDGCDWETTQAAAMLRSGQVYHAGRGTGLLFQNYTADDTSQYGYMVTSPRCHKAETCVQQQTVLAVPEASLIGGYDPRLAGFAPWSRKHPALLPYFKGQGATPAERQAIAAAGSQLHAVTDSAASATALATGVKVFNDSVNIDIQGNPLPTLFLNLQRQGWKVGTATSVPFNHASAAAMYAWNVSRNEYHDLARHMLGLPGRVQELGKFDPVPGLDVVLGTGHVGDIHRYGAPYLAYRDRLAADIAHGGRYLVVETIPGGKGSDALHQAAKQARAGGHRLFGCFGSAKFDHLPYQTVDRGFNPAQGIAGQAEQYSAAELREQPTLLDFTEAALTVLSAEPGQPFALFVEAGDIDWALHSNNLDNALGAVYSAEEAVARIITWVEKHSNWQDSAMIVTADHGHLLQIHDPQTLAAIRRNNAA